MIEAVAAPTLEEMQERVYEVNLANGWFEEDRSKGEDYALLHSEVAEALEAYRSWGFEDKTAVLCCHGKFQADWDAHDASLRAGEHLCKPEGVGSELADILVRILDTAQRWETKLGWLTLGQVELIQLDGKSFADHLEHLHRLLGGHNLRSALRATVTLALDAHTDLQEEFDRKVAYNATRGHRHGGKRL